MSTDIHSQISSKIHSFASELEVLVRRAALEAVADALGTRAAKAAAAGAHKKAVAHKPLGRKGGKRVRRSPEALNAAAENIFRHIKGHPGQRSEEVRAALRIDKKVWIPAVKQLLEEKKIVSKGQKRATTYSAK